MGHAEMSSRAAGAGRNKKNLRDRFFQTLSVGWVLCLLGCVGGFDAEPLVEFSTEVNIQGDSPQTITRQLRPGVYLLEIRERDIDLRVKVGNGILETTIADDVPRHGLHVKVVRLAVPTTVLVAIHNADDATKTGHARLRIMRLPAAADAPATALEQGYASFSAAGEQIALNTVEARTRAVVELHHAIGHFREAGDIAAQAQAEYSLANLEYLCRNEWKSAVRAAEEARRSYESAGDTEGVQNAMTMRATSEIELGDAMNSGPQRAEREALFASADKTLAATDQFFTVHRLDIRAEYAVNMRGIGALFSGDLESAVALFTRAIEIARATHDTMEEIKARSNLAWTHNRRGYIAQAAGEYATLLALLDRKRAPYLYGAVVANYAQCLITLGDFDRALALDIEALALFTALDQEQERAVALSAIGSLYLQMGDPERALPALTDAAAAQERFGNPRILMGILRTAGNAAAALGDHSQALALLRRAAQGDADAAGVARTRVLIAGELRALGDLHGAEREITMALESGNALVRANALEARGNLRLVQEQLPAAVADLRAADIQYTGLGLDFNRIDVNATLSQALLRTCDVAGASIAADEAIAIERRIRVKSANPEWRARFLAKGYAPYEARIAADFAADDANEEQKSWRAFQVAEQIRARSLADRLAHTPSALAEAPDPTGDLLRARLTAQQLSLESRLQSAKIEAAATQALRSSIMETRAQIEAHLSRQGTLGAVDPAPGIPLSQIQSALPPDTVVLAFFVGNDSTHVWLLTHDEFRHANAPGYVQLQRAVRGFATSLRAPTTRSGGEKLARALLGGLLDGLSEKRLMVLPDGPLNGLPFAALPLPGGASGELLVDRFVIAMAPSLDIAMRSRETGDTVRTKVAVVFDPVFSTGDRRLTLAHDGGVGKLRGSEPFARLPYTAMEARAVVGAFGASDTIELAGFDATASRVVALRSQPLRVLHFATHAVARSDSPELSALYLSKYAADGSLLPANRLTAADISASGLRADVVVLSGCATGDGSELRGEGVLGLTYGFLANGSRLVIASLWPIEDASTARFMEKFYAAYQKTGRAADALRIA